jgi:hypothetical protein
LLSALTLAVSGLRAGNIEEPIGTARVVVRADPRSGRLVRRVVVPERVVKPILLTSRPMAAAARPAPDAQGHLRDVIEDVSSREGVDPLLVHALIQVESGYNRFAISPKGAEGLMQLIPATARRMGVRNSFDSRENIEGGVKYLRGLLDRFPDLRHALAAYNAGPGAVSRHGGIPPYAETQDYVVKVGKRYGDLRRTELGREARVAATGSPAPAAPAEPVYRPLESFLDGEGRLHLRTR